MDSYREIIGETLNEYTGEVIFTNLSYRRSQTYLDTLFTLKENVEAVLKDKTPDDYQLVYALYVDGLPFAILEKNDEIFLTGLINDVIKENSGYYEMLNEEALRYLEKPVMTIEETNEFLDIADKIFVLKAGKIDKVGTKDEIMPSLLGIETGCRFVKEDK